MRRVEPGHPEQSWLYIKLAGPGGDADALNVFAPDDWDPETESECNDAFPFPGSIMPYADGDPVDRLRPNELRMIAEWILDGAPGPVTP